MAILITLAEIPPGVVFLISAGDENPLIDVCGATPPLDAVIAGDPTGHVFLWEQISGGAVIIDDPTAITTFFTNVGGDDKIFRFWIDKGEVDEQQADLLFSNTPQSPVHGFHMPSVPTGVGITAQGPEAFPVTTVNGGVVNTPEPPAQDHGQGVVNSVFTLTWDHPGQANDAYITQYTVIENTTPVLSLPASPLAATATGTAPLGPPSDLKEYTLGAITSYEVSSLYNFHGFAQAISSAVFDFSGIVVDPTEAIDDGQEGFSMSADGVGISLTRFSNILLEAPTDDAEGFSMSEKGIGFSVTRFSTVLLTTPTDDAEGFSMSAAGTSFSVTRFDPSGIGGGGG